MLNLYMSGLKLYKNTIEILSFLQHSAAAVKHFLNQQIYHDEMFAYLFDDTAFLHTFSDGVYVTVAFLFQRIQ